MSEALVAETPRADSTAVMHLQVIAERIQTERQKLMVAQQRLKAESKAGSALEGRHRQLHDIQDEIRRLERKYQALYYSLWEKANVDARRPQSRQPASAGGNGLHAELNFSYRNASQSLPRIKTWSRSSSETTNSNGHVPVLRSYGHTMQHPTYQQPLEVTSISAAAVTPESPYQYDVAFGARTSLPRTAGQLPHSVSVGSGAVVTEHNGTSGLDARFDAMTMAGPPVVGSHARAVHRSLENILSSGNPAAANSTGFPPPPPPPAAAVASGSPLRSISVSSGAPSVSTNQTTVELQSQPVALYSPVKSASSDEALSETSRLIFENGRLVSGTLEALIEHLTPTSSYMPERTFVFAFVLCSRLFIRPHILLTQVCKNCLLLQRLGQVGVDASQLGQLGDHIMQLLRHWTSLFPHDFRDDRMTKLLAEMLDRVSMVFPELRPAGERIRSHLAKSLADMEKYKQQLEELARAPQHSLMNVVRTTDMTSICPSTTLLAQQLTHIELERYRRVGPEEFIEAFVRDPAKNLQFYDDNKPCNLEAYVQWFNRLSALVATEICVHLKKKARVRAIEYFIDVAKDSFNIGNFNSFMAIVAGLNLSPVSRLTKTWSRVNDAKLKVLEQHISPSNNFASYRSTLKAALWRSESATYERERIVIPFFSLLVKDLHFYNEGCANRLPNGHINFDKFWHLSKQLMEIFAWKQVQCPFECDQRIQHYLLTCPIYSEQSLMLTSFECEGPSGAYERDQYKKLKSEMQQNGSPKYSRSLSQPAPSGS